MLLFLIAGFLVVLPGVVVVLWFIFTNPTWAIPAVVSVALNILPFVVAILLLRSQKRRGGTTADLAEH